MFCGIVDHIGKIEAIQRAAESMVLKIQTQFQAVVLGESIAVDGTCLTVTDFNEQYFVCELSPETIKKTVARQYKVGQDVNLERAMRMGDRIGGHLVTGHVDQTIRVNNLKMQDGFLAVNFDGYRPDLCKAFLISKGSVMINGVSLTINSVAETSFDVMLIPHTLKRTTLHALELGQFVNVEWDYMAKLIKNQ